MSNITIVIISMNVNIFVTSCEVTLASYTFCHL